MGKRGPKPSGGFEDKTKVLSTRITAPLRDGLEEAAKASGRSLSSEIEYRLRRSFDDDRVIEQLGGPQLYAMLRTISATMLMAGTGWASASINKQRQSTDWLNDPDAYDQAVKATIKVLEAFRPPGDPSARQVRRTMKTDSDALEADETDMSEVAAALRDTFARISKDRGRFFANLLLREIGETEPTQPAPGEKLSKVDELTRRIASELGDAHNRLQRSLK